MDEDRAAMHTYQDGDGTWVLVGTDGACSDAKHPLLARAGLGVFYGTGHSQNRSEQLFGPQQSAARAEIAAIRHVVKHSFAPTHIICDNKSAVTGLELLLEGHDIHNYEHQDLWADIAAAVRMMPGHFRISHVPSHQGMRGLNEGTISVVYKFLNDGADTLAVEGALQHAVPTRLREAAVKRIRQAVVLHQTAAKILAARAKARPLPHRCAGYTDAQLAQLHETVDQVARAGRDGGVELHDEEFDFSQILRFEHGGSPDFVEEDEAANAMGLSMGID